MTTPTCGVYYLTDGLNVLYVGQSVNVERRLQKHAASDIDFSQVFVDRCDRARLLDLEAAAIRRYRPPFNENNSLPARS